MRRYEDLEVWQLGHELVLKVYRVTAGYPDHERFGLVPQMRRAGISTPANLAEGSDRGTDRELARSCDIASGSAAELDYHWRLWHDLGYLAARHFESLQAETRVLRAKLHGLSAYLRRS